MRACPRLFPQATRAMVGKRALPLFIMFKEVTIQSLGELLDRVTPRQRDSISGRRREYALFRGTPDTPWGLLTGLDRLGGIAPPHSKAALEEHILRNFLRYGRPHLPASASNVWELMITAQHHGLPTRLLDWSYSPLVAAHFATYKALPGGGCVIWKLDWRRLHDHFGLKPLAFLVSDLDEALARSGYASPWDLFTEKKTGASPFICMLEPPALDARLVAQAAAFTLCSSKRHGFDRILQENKLEDSLTKLVIPPGKVDKIRDQLDLCAMDERRLFPDLDGVASELLRYYAATPEAGPDLEGKMKNTCHPPGLADSGDTVPSSGGPPNEH